MRADLLERMTPEGQKLARELHRLYRRERISAWAGTAKWVFGAMGLLAIIIGGLGLLIRTDALSEASESQRARGAARDAQIAAIQADLLTVCRESDFKTPVAEARCVRATQAPVPTPPTMDAEALRVIVQDVVADELAQNPPADGKAPPPEQILATVRRVYAENKPRDGRTPSDEELLTLIRQVYAENPPPPGKDGKDGAPGKDGEPGTPGKDGAPGQNVTPEQVYGAFQAYCAANPAQCQGPPGKDGAPGAPGRGITSREYRALDPDGEEGPREFSCYEVTEYTQQPSPEYIRVSGVLCTPA